MVLVDRHHVPALASLACTADRVVVVGPPSAAAPAGARGWEWVARPGSMSQLHTVLLEIGDVGLVVVAVQRTMARRTRLVARLAPHVAAGGHVLVVVPRDKQRDLVARLSQLRGRVETRGGHGIARWQRELGVAIGAPSRSRAGVLVPKTVQHLRLLRDGDVAEVLAHRSATSVEHLASLPAGSKTSSRIVTSFPDATPLGQLSNTLSYPRMDLRRYEGEIILSAGSLARTERFVLPESFKWQGKRLHQPKLTQVEGRFGRLRENDSPPTRLEGAFYFFDYAHPGHYGHLMTEAIAKLWGWDEAKEALPDLRLLLRRHPRDAGRTRPRPDLAVLRAFGVAERDIVWVDGPVVVDTLVGATPMWHNSPPFQAHPAMRAIWRRLRDGFHPEGVSPAEGDRLFVTRREGNRPCRNVDEVEAIFSELGYTIVHPGALTPQEQCHAFSNARVVAGFGGTGMFNMLYADQVSDVVVLNHDAYLARNEHMMSELLDANIHYFWSKADVPADGRERSYAASQSTWEFDVSTHAEALRSLLTRLG